MKLTHIILKHGKLEALRLIGERAKSEDIATGQAYQKKIKRLYPNQGFLELPFQVNKTLLMIDKKTEELDEWIWKNRNKEYEVDYTVT